MRFSRRLSCSSLLLAALLLPGSVRADAQTLGSIGGALHDAQGAALPGISLTLSASDTAEAAPSHATTDKLGEFHFDHVALGIYSLTSNVAGTLSPTKPITLSALTPVLHLDLTLVDVSQAVVKPPALQLQAAGIRGYIDPGGYSAPAGAAAASKLIQGAADLNRTNTSELDTAMCGREPLLLKAVSEHPDDALAQQQLGQYYLATHEPQKAIPPLERARVLDKREFGTLLSLPEALLQDKQFASAHDLLTNDAAGGDKAAIHRLLARSDEGQGAFQQASAEYKAAAALAGAEADFYGAGYELILAGSAAAAVKVFEEGIARYLGSTTLLTGLGTADFLLGQTAEATRIFLRCVTLHPEDARLYAFLSASYAISDVEPDAVAASFRRYHELFPTRADAAYFYAISISRKGAETSEAETLLMQAVQLEPGFAKAHLQLGLITFDRGDYAHAADEFATALRLDPSLSEAHYRLSLAYRRTGRARLADEQMKLFRAGQSQSTQGDQLPDVHIEQFLSVFAQPSTTPGQNLPCTGAKP